MTQAWEIEGFLDVQNNQLHIDGLSAVELAKQHGTPLFVFSETRIRRNIERLKKAKDVIGCDLKICYAAKANSTMAILRAIRDAGSDIEVNSGGELWKALKIGFAPDQIIFNGTSKEVWEIENAISAGIYAIQVDSLYELSLIEETAERLNKKASVSLRLVPEIETNTHSGLQTALLTSKFGMMPDEALSAFRNYKDSPHLNLSGIHLHIGSQNPDASAYAEALQILFHNLLQIFNETGIKLSHINLGGGFPVNYLRSDDAMPALTDGQRQKLSKGDRDAIKKLEAQRQMLSADFEPNEAIKGAWDAVKKIAAAANALYLLENLTLMLEPGRSIVSDAGICLTTVRNTKERPLSDINRELNAKLQEIERNRPSNESVGFGVSHIKRSFVDKSIDRDTWLLTDAGFNILLSMETYKWYYHLISATRTGEAHDFPYKLAGPLCDGGDVYFDIEGQNRLPDHRLLPTSVEPGEVLALLNCGAYSFAQASQYNGRFLPAVVLVRENGKAELVRKRDSFKDLIRNDLF